MLVDMRKFFLFLTVLTFFHMGVQAHEELEKQIVTWSKKIEDDPNNAASYLKRGTLYRLHKEYKKSLKDFKRAKKLDASLVVVDFNLAELYLDASDPDNALKAIEAFIKVRAKHASARILKGKILEAKKEYLKAAKSYSAGLKRCVGKIKALPQYYLSLSACYVKAGDKHIPEAIKALDAGIAKLGRLSTLQQQAIELELKIKNYEGALKRNALLISWYGKLPVFLIQKAEILNAKGDREAAIKGYREALAAIEAYPPARQKVKAFVALKEKIQAALKKLIRN